MKRKFFSYSLYSEGFRQLRLMGLLFTVAVSLIVMFIPLGEFMTTVRPTVGQSIQTVTYDEMNPLMITAFCIVAPFLVINLFSFVNKRESSDYYHAIPATRTCLFFSFFAAAVTWLAIFTFGTALLSTVCHWCFPSLFAVNIYSVLQMSFNCFVGGLLVAACVAIAMSVTGTFMMNVLLALLIIFLPRILLKLVLTSICEAFPLVENLVFAPLLNTQYNIPAGYILQFFFGGADDMLTSVSSALYTLALAVVYILVAWWLFVKRRSEGAGHAAPSPKLQALYRFLVGFTITSIITISLYNDYNQYYDASDLVPWIFVYVLALFATLVFEILCTRKFKGLIRRMLITIGLLAVANVALVLGVHGSTCLLFNYSPEPSEISSVRLVEFSTYYDSGYGDEDYFAERSKKINLTDPEILEIVSRQLDASLDILKTSKSHYFEHLYANSSVVVSIKSGGVSHLRRIFLYEEDLKLLADRLAENKEYQQVYMKLPADFNYIRCSGMFLNDTTTEAKLLFSTLQEEVNALGFAEWYALLNGGNRDEQYDKLYGTNGGEILTTLYITKATATGWTEAKIPLYTKVLPKTAAAYVKIYNEGHKLQRDQLINAFINNPQDCDYIELNVFNTEIGDTGSSSLFIDNDKIKENADALLAFGNTLMSCMNEPIDPTQPFCHLTVSFRSKYNVTPDEEIYDYRAYESYFAIPEGCEFPVIEKE